MLPWCRVFPVNDSIKYESGFDLFKHKIPNVDFSFVLAGLTVWSHKTEFVPDSIVGID